MAENKKSFILYADMQGLFNQLPDDVAGRLIKHIYAYVNDENPTSNDILLNIAFEPIKMQLKRDLKNWEGTKEGRSESGRKGGINSGIARREKKQNEANEASALKLKQNEANEAVNVNVNVNVNDTENESSIHEPAQKIENSNLFRKPKIPLFEDVHMVFIQQGGTKEMAEAFFNKNEATGWFLNGSPIGNFAALLPNFIRNWKKNEINGSIKPKSASGYDPNGGISFDRDRWQYPENLKF